MAEAVHIRFGVACRYACRPICDGHPRCRDVLLRLQLARSRSRGLETSGMIYYVVRTTYCTTTVHLDAMRVWSRIGVAELHER